MMPRTQVPQRGDAMFDWLKGLFRGTEDSQAEAYKEAVRSLRWIPADETPWNIPVLDVQPITQEMLSFSEKPEPAMNFASHRGSDGSEWVGVPPSHPHPVAADLSYRVDGPLVDGILFMPMEMENKWVMYYREPQIIMIRSWTREVVAVAPVKIEGEVATVSEINGTFLDEDEPPWVTAATFDFLIRTHCLHENFPALLPPETGLEEKPEGAAIWCFHLFGRHARFASHLIPNRSTPEPFLRTITNLHLNAFNGATDSVTDHLAKGVPIDLKDQEGTTPLGWAIMGGKPEAARLLLERGATAEYRNDRGVTPLMSTAEFGHAEIAAQLLENGAAIDAADPNGYTSLHRAAQLGHADVVDLLLDRGARSDIEADGQTPLDLAKQHDQTAIVERLEGPDG